MALDAISVNGRFCVLAIDHRDSLKAFLSPDDPDAIAAAELTSLKIDLVRGLGDLATGVMLEPEYSIPQVQNAGVLADDVGFIAALEAQGYLGDPATAATRVLDGWSVEAAFDAGASAVKLLLPYHPDRQNASAQQTVAETIVADADRVGLPLVLEPLFYGLEHPAERLEVVLETAARFSTIGAGLLKMPFPVDPVHQPDHDVWLDACLRMDELIPVPWTLLSGGGDFGLFYDQVAVALNAGSSGCMVGRALWAEAAWAGPQDRSRTIADVVRPRFERLNDLVIGGTA
ncbi:MAG: hypothetical protein ACR2PK_08295 [Acidimicrobiales bacterium]